MRLTLCAVAVVMAMPTYAQEPPLLSLSQAREHAYQQDVELLALTRLQTANVSRIQQQGRLSNPELAVEMDNLGSSPDPQTLAISISQSLPLHGQLTGRRAVAEQQQRLNQQAIRQRQAEVAAEVRLCFAQWQFALEQAQLRQADADIAVSQAQVVTEKWRAGRAIVSDSERMRALATEATFVMQRQRQQVTTQQRECQLLLGVPVAQPSAQPLPVLSDKPISLNQHYSELLRDSADASYRLANQERFPELRLSVGMRRYQSTGDNALVLGAALPLPLFDRNQVARLESQGQQQAAMRRAELSMTRGSSRLEQLTKELAMAQEQLVVLDKQVLPTTLQSLVIAEASYKAGKTGLSDWLDAKRLWREASERRLSAALSLQETASNIEREFGVQN